LALFKNFLFNWSDYNFAKASFVKLLGVWEYHLESPFTQGIAYLFFGLVIIGVVFSLIRKKTANFGMVQNGAFSGDS